MNYLLDKNKVLYVNIFSLVKSLMQTSIYLPFVPYYTSKILTDFNDEVFKFYVYLSLKHHFSLT